MTYSDAFNLRTTNVSFNNIADAIDGTLTRVWGGVTSGTSTAYTAAPSPVFTTWTAGDILVVTPHTTNTASSTIDVSSLGTRTIRYCNVDLVGGELVAGVEAVFVYDLNNYFNLIGHGGGWASWTPTYTAASGTFTSVTTTKAIYQRHGNLVFFAIQASGTTSAGTTELRFSLPVTAADTSYRGGGSVFDGSTTYAAYWGLFSTSVAVVSNYNTSSLGTGAGRQLNVSGFYQC